MLTEHEIEHMFGHTAASIEGTSPKEDVHAELRAIFKQAAYDLDFHLPDSPEKTQAFIELQTAAMWFHKALAHNP